jgi:NAD dependent epimerase/dehydratase family enzyme
MGRELLLTSQRVVPKSLADGGFDFRQPSLAGALASLFAT